MSTFRFTQPFVRNATTDRPTERRAIDIDNMKGSALLRRRALESEELSSPFRVCAVDLPRFRGQIMRLGARRCHDAQDGDGGGREQGQNGDSKALNCPLKRGRLRLESSPDPSSPWQNSRRAPSGPFRPDRRWKISQDRRYSCDFPP